MAITSGAGPHAAWLVVDGTSMLVENGSVTQSAKRKTSTFHCSLPFTQANYDALAGIGDNDASVVTQTRGTTATLITGEIDKVRFDYIGGIIQVSGRDKSAKLHDNKTSEKWLNKKPSEIIQDLVGRVGLSGNITSSDLMAGKKTVQDFVKLSDNVSFAYVIHKLSQLDGARWWVDPNGQFHYVPSGSPTGTYSIFVDRSGRPIASDCLDLVVSRNVQAGKSIKVTYKSWHPRQKQVFQGETTISGKGGPLEFNFHVPNLQQEHVDKYAKSTATERARHEINVSATVVGDPSVNAGMGLQLSGTQFYDGTYDIDTVTHNFGMSGHRTHIVARGPGQGRSAS